MIVPSTYSLTKLSDDEFFGWLRNVHIRRQDAVIKQKVHNYCVNGGIPSVTMINEFFDPATTSPICLSVNASNGQKCTRITKPGTNYCGYHKRHHDPRQRRRRDPVRTVIRTTLRQPNGNTDFQAV